MACQKITVFSSENTKENLNATTSFSSRLPLRVEQLGHTLQLALQNVICDLRVRKIPDEFLPLNGTVGPKSSVAIATEIVTRRGRVTRKIVFLDHSHWNESKNTDEFKEAVMKTLEPKFPGWITIKENEHKFVEFEIKHTTFIVEKEFATWIGMDLKGVELVDYRGIPCYEIEEEMLFRRRSFRSKKPNHVQISSDLVVPFPTSNGFSQVLATIPVSGKDFHLQHFQYSPEILNFYDLRSGDLTSIGVQLLDEDRKLIRPLSGASPTVATFLLRKKIDMEETLVISIDSADCQDKFVKNTTSNFSVELPYPKILTGPWSVALDFISLPAKMKFNTYLKNLVVYDVLNNPTAITVPEDRPIYSESDIHAEIAAGIVKCLKNYAEEMGEDYQDEPLVSIDDAHKISINFPLSTKISFSDAFRKILESGDKQFETVADEPSDIDTITFKKIEPQALLIETNFTKHVMFGDHFKRIVKIVPFKSSNSNKPYFYQNDKLDYIGVDTNRNLYKIDIKIADLEGNVMEFDATVPTTINFLFKKD